MLSDVYVKILRWSFGYQLIDVCPTFPAQRSPAQPRPTRPSPAQLRPAQSSPGHANPAQPSPGKASSTQLSPAQASPAKPKCFCYVSNSQAEENTIIPHQYLQQKNANDCINKKQPTRDKTKSVAGRLRVPARTLQQYFENVAR